MQPEFKNFEGIVDALIETQLANDEDYQMQSKSNHLKSAEQIKAQNKQQIREQLRMDEYQHKLGLACKIIAERLPRFIHPQNWAQVLSEFEESLNRSLPPANPVKESQVDPTLIFQNILGISNDTVNFIYQLGKQLINENEYEKAAAIFTFLHFLNPFVSEFWMGAGMSLYYGGLNEEALIDLEIAHLLATDRAAPWVYTALCHLSLNNKNAVREDLKQINKLFQKNKEEKVIWNDVITSIKDQL